jgi:hypothetical protein
LDVISPVRTRLRARLANCLAASGVRSTIGAISSNGRSNTSCSTNATRSAGESVSRTTSNAIPTESASNASCSGSLLVSAIGSTTSASRASSRRERRERKMSRQIRATTVVSQPPRLATSLVLELFSRSHVSCTASSASLVEPSMR